MSNPYFRFKKFTVQQERCAMKVTTDACLFGALVAEAAKKQKPVSILDIGAGTGLLSLMLAQVTDCPVDAVEIDTDAYTQAHENFARTAWAKNRLKAHHNAIQDYTDDNQYDLIISNPPFFKHHMTGQNRARTRAMHDHELPSHELAQSIKRLISPTGMAHVMLPRHEMYSFSREMQELEFYEHTETRVFNRPGKGIFRLIKSFSLVESILHYKENLVVRTPETHYSWRFKQLLQDYYLNIH